MGGQGESKYFFSTGQTGPSASQKSSFVGNPLAVWIYVSALRSAFNHNTQNRILIERKTED